MQILVLFIIALLFVGKVWRYILRKSAYPAIVPKWVKIIHAVIVALISIEGLLSINQLLNGLFRHQLQTWPGRVPNEAFYALAWGVGSVGGVILLFVSTGMAKREKKALTWFFVLWPLKSICDTYAGVEDGRNHFPNDILLQGIVIFMVISVLPIVFYMSSATRTIWEQPTVPQTSS